MRFKFSSNRPSKIVGRRKEKETKSSPNLYTISQERIIYKVLMQLNMRLRVNLKHRLKGTDFTDRLKQKTLETKLKHIRLKLRSLNQLY